MKLGIWAKFLLLLVSVSALPLAFLGWQLLKINKSEIASATLELQTKLAAGLAARVESAFENSQKNASFLEASLTRKDLDFSQKRAIIETYMETHPLILEVSIIEKGSGQRVIQAFKEGVRLKEGPAERRLWQEAEKNGAAFSLTPTEPSQQEGWLQFLFYRPLRSGLFLFLREDAERLVDAIHTERFGGTGYAYLIDQEGAVLTPAPRYQWGTVLKNHPLVSTALKSAASSGSLHFTDPSSAKELVGSWSPVDLADRFYWILVEQLSSEAYAAQEKLKRRAIMILVLVIAVTSLMAYFSAQKASWPILELTGAAESIARGNFEISFQNQNRQDELGHLQRTFAQMASKLKQYAEIQLDRLLAEKTKMEATVASMQEGIVLFKNPEGEVLLINGPARRILASHLEESDILGKPLKDVLEPGRRDEILRIVQDLDEGKIKRCDIDTSATPNTKQIVEIKLQGVEARKQDGALAIGQLLILRDVTLERQIQSMKDDFVQMVTHDLKNPLNSITGFVEVLGMNGQNLAETQKKAIRQISQAAGRLLNMVNNILDSFRIEHGAFKINPAAMDLRQTAAEIVEMLSGRAASLFIGLELNLEPDDSSAEKWRVLCDGSLIERVLINLIGNALKYTSAQGRITVTLRDAGQDIVVCVADTGEGIPKDDLDKLFKKYGQIQGRSKGGTGLGLMICKTIVEAHNGKIWVTSELGRGSAFAFSLPKKIKDA
ncbi:MAG: HAMP domain-containing protein [Elusimicrobia bacterium]|nr:HAMP domain-containing protein [Elusimicrobiota bacterium]